MLLAKVVDEAGEAWSLSYAEDDGNGANVSNAAASFAVVLVAVVAGRIAAANIA